MRFSTVVITVPHGYCDENIPVRNCDRLSLSFARKLFQLFTKANFTTYLIRGNVPRWQCDLNRLECRYANFRRQLDWLLNQLNPNDTILLDIHSFPNSEFGQHAIFLLDYPPLLQSVSYPLVNYLLNMNSNSKAILLQGTNENDVLISSRNKGFYNSYLIEVNENLSENTLQQLAETVFQYFNNDTKL